VNPAGVFVPCGICDGDVPSGRAHIDTGTGIMYCDTCCPCRLSYLRRSHRCYSGARHLRRADCGCYCQPCLRAVIGTGKAAS
jgi:hypothetical protein